MPDAYPDKAWHQLDPEAVLAGLDTELGGLSKEQAAQRLEQYGQNVLPAGKPIHPFMRFLRQFHNTLIYVLLAAALITGAMQHWLDAAVIAGVVLINAVIGFLQEGKAEAALEGIRKLLSHSTTVMRGGYRMVIPASEVVPGDIVLLQSGDKLPADLRLVKVQSLRVQEAALTGESEAVEKSVEPVSPEAALGDRRSMAYAGTVVTYGQATGIAVGTGEDTEIGRINLLVNKVQSLTTPLLRQMTQFSRILTGIILALAAATMLFGMLVRDYAAAETFVAAVALAVAAIPEGLPAIMTITLAIGVQAMARRNAIIRRLPAVETLGCVSVICSDKTGTLTRNEMTVRSIVTPDCSFEVTGSGYVPEGAFLVDAQEIDPQQRQHLEEITRAALLCCDATVRHCGDDWVMEGDPTEAALVVAAIKAGTDPDTLHGSWPRTDSIPFESEHRFMATLHHDHAGHARIFVKGAPERLLTMCRRQHTSAGDAPLDTAFWHERMNAVAARGERVLAIAVRETQADHDELLYSDVDGGLALLGIFGLMDPPREEAIAAVAKCREAGIQVKMITGDHAQTACAIAGKLQLPDADRVLTGPELDELDEQALRRVVPSVNVFARTSPEHKLRLVEALQANNWVVAMTGDGVNDAPALKRADVGIAMGMKGTEAAKEAAEMVLADDNFATISHAVEEGRVIYDNIKKSILFILPTNGGEALTVLAAILFGMLLPITPVQILWINMVTAVTLALALAFEPAETDIMQRPPRAMGEPLLSRFLAWRVMLVSALLVIGVFGIFRWLRLEGADLETARTAAVNTLVLFEVFYLFNVRRQKRLRFSDLFGWQARYCWLAVAIVIGLQLAFTYLGFMQALFHSRPLSLNIWAVILLVTSSIFALIEMEKILLLNNHRRSEATHEG